MRRHSFIALTGLLFFLICSTGAAAQEPLRGAALERLNREAARRLNQQAPIRLDDQTVIVGAIAGPISIIVLHTVSFTVPPAQRGSFERDFRAERIRQLCRNNTSVHVDGTIFVYQYADQSGFVFRVTVSARECAPYR